MTKHTFSLYGAWIVMQLLSASGSSVSNTETDGLVWVPKSPNNCPIYSPYSQLVNGMINYRIPRSCALMSGITEFTTSVESKAQGSTSYSQSTQTEKSGGSSSNNVANSQSSTSDTECDDSNGTAQTETVQNNGKSYNNAAMAEGGEVSNDQDTTEFTDSNNQAKTGLNVSNNEAITEENVSNNEATSEDNVSNNQVTTEDNVSKQTTTEFNVSNDENSQDSNQILGAYANNNNVISAKGSQRAFLYGDNRLDSSVMKGENENDKLARTVVSTEKRTTSETVSVSQSPQKQLQQPKQDSQVPIGALQPIGIPKQDRNSIEGSFPNYQSSLAQQQGQELVPQPLAPAPQYDQRMPSQFYNAGQPIPLDQTSQQQAAQPVPLNKPYVGPVKVEFCLKKLIIRKSDTDESGDNEWYFWSGLQNKKVTIHLKDYKVPSGISPVSPVEQVIDQCSSDTLSSEEAKELTVEAGGYEDDFWGNDQLGKGFTYVTWDGDVTKGPLEGEVQGGHDKYEYTVKYSLQYSKPT
jgi:hypothetical protein